MTIRIGYCRGKPCFMVGWVGFRSYPRAARMLKEALAEIAYIEARQSLA